MKNRSCAAGQGWSAAARTLLVLLQGNRGCFGFTLRAGGRRDGSVLPSAPPNASGCGAPGQHGCSSPVSRWTRVGRGRSWGGLISANPESPVSPLSSPSLPGHLLPAGLGPTGLAGRLRQLHAALRQPQRRDPRAAGERPRRPSAGGGGSVLTAVAESALRGNTAPRAAPTASTAGLGACRAGMCGQRGGGFIVWGCRGWEGTRAV